MSRSLCFIMLSHSIPHSTIRALSAFTHRRIAADGARITGRTARERRCGDGAVVARAETGARVCALYLSRVARAASFNELKRSAHKYLFVFPDFSFFQIFSFPDFSPFHFSCSVQLTFLVECFVIWFHIFSTLTRT